MIMVMLGNAIEYAIGYAICYTWLRPRVQGYFLEGMVTLVIS